MLAHGRKQRRQVLAQQLQVGLVARAHRHLDVDVAALLGGEVVAAAVEREGGDARLALEDDGAAVALVHVEAGRYHQNIKYAYPLYKTQHPWGREV